LQGRYPKPQAYVGTVRAASDALTAQCLLLPEDARRLVAEA
jgi:hypothetical protein